MYLTLNVNVITILVLYNSLCSSDMDYIPDTWVDPTDMRNYDRHNKRMRSPSSNEKALSVAVVGNNDSGTDQTKELKRFEIFVERFINHILSTANLKNKEMQPRTRIMSEIPVSITSEELRRLKKLSESVTAESLNEVDEIFSAILTDERGFSFDSLTPYLNPIQQLFFNISYEKITVLILICVFGVVMWMFAVGRELKKIIIFLYLTFFMGGLGWNWWKMYQEAVIEQYAEMQRLSQVPDTCVPKRVGFFEYFFSSSSPSEDCRKYHLAFRFDPFSKIPPSIVFSETVSGMVVHPLKAIGSSVGEFLIGVNSAALWPLNIIFLPFIFLTSAAALLCVVIVSLGVKLNFWTLFGGVSIGGKIKKEIPNHPTVTDAFSLRRTIDFENENHFVITQVGTIKKCITAVQEKRPIIESFENRSSSTSVVNRRFRFTNIPKNLQNYGKTLNFGFGDCELYCNSNETENQIKIHWSNILRQLNSNIKQKVPTVLNQRSVIHKKKYK